MAKSVLYEDSFGLSRIAALSDGVFSIVITLLVFDLKLPVGATAQSLRADLVALTPKFCTYVLTFFIIGIYWIGHHGVFRHVRRYDRTFLWVNVFFLMFVAFLPFPTSLLGSFPTEQAASLVYGLTLIGTGLSLRMLWKNASIGYRLIDSTLNSEVIAIAHKRILLAPAVALLSILISFVSVRVSIFLYVLAGMAYFLPSRLDRYHKSGIGVPPEDAK